MVSHVVTTIIIIVLLCWGMMLPSSFVCAFPYTSESKETLIVDAIGRKIVFGWTPKSVNNSHHYSFTLQAYNLRTWLAVGITNSTGIGESFMIPNSVAVIGKAQPFPDAKEYELHSTTNIGAWLLGDLNNQQALQKCYNSFCAGIAGLCNAQPLCASAITCTQNSLGSNITTEELLTLCIGGLVNDTSTASVQALGAYLQTSGCVYSNCAGVLEGQGRVSSLLSASFAQVLNVSTSEWSTTLVFESTLGGIAGRRYNPSSQTFIFAFGSDNSFGYHGSSNRMAITLNLVTGDRIENGAIPHFVLIHAALTTIGLGVVIPFGVALKLVLKSEWHGAIQLVGLCIAGLGVLIAFFNFSVDFGRVSHHIVGLISMLLLMFQPFTILLKPAAKSDEMDENRKQQKPIDKQEARDYEQAFAMWKLLHSCNGFLTLLLALIAAALGYAFVSSRTTAASSIMVLPILFYVSFSLVVILKLGVMIREWNKRRATGQSFVESGAENPKFKNAVVGLGKDFEEEEDSGERITPMFLGFREISYVAPLSRREKREGKAPRKIIDNACGYCAPRTLTAIMGPSGAGKSTLLDVLALRLGDSFEGDVRINGVDAFEFPHLSFVSGYVRQNDVLHQYLTVWESFAYTAKLVINGDDTKRNNRIMRVVAQLSLGHTLNTLIGGPDVRGLSGGEKRRVSVGLQLIKSPSLLFLDEPTSGLDSHTALKLVEALRDLANEGRTIVTTIHQPSANLFECFDRLVLLSNGKTVFSGSRLQAEKFFSQIRRDVPSRWNPADWYLTVVDVERDTVTGGDEARDGKPNHDSYRLPDKVIDKLKGNRNALRKSVHVEFEGLDISALADAIRNFYLLNNPEKLEQNPKIVDECTKYAMKNGVDQLNKHLQKTYNGRSLDFQNGQRSKVHPCTKEELEKFVATFNGSSYMKELERRFFSDASMLLSESNGEGKKNEPMDYAQPLGTQTKVLLNRAALLAFRDPQVLKFQAIQNVVFGIILGSLYSNLGNSQGKAYALSMAIVIILGMVAMVTVALGTVVAYNDKLVFERESQDRLYAPLATFFARFLVAVPQGVFIAACLIIPCYWWIGLKANGFFFFFIVNCAIIFLFDGVVSCVVFVVNDLPSAFGVGNFYEAIAIFMSGIFIPYPLIPVFWRWLFFITPFSYAYAACAVNEFENGPNEWWLNTIGILWRSKYGNFVIVVVMGLCFRLTSLWLAVRMNAKFANNRRKQRLVTAHNNNNNNVLVVVGKQNGGNVNNNRGIVVGRKNDIHI